MADIRGRGWVDLGGMSALCSTKLVGFHSPALAIPEIQDPLS
jgi:hypothetical protein